MSLPRPATHAAALFALLLAPMATLNTASRILIEQSGGCDLYFTDMVCTEVHIEVTPV